MSEEFFNKTVKTVKNNATPGVQPMCFFSDKEENVTIVILAGLSKPAMKIAIYSLSKQHNFTQLVIVLEAWYIKRKSSANINIKPSEQHDKKECFIISYFSKDKEISKVLPFKRKKKEGKDICIWEEDSESDIELPSESTFNPFTMTEEVILKNKNEVEMEIMRESGKKETINIDFNFKIILYRHEKKVFFEVLNQNGRVFMITPPCDDDEDFKIGFGKFKKEIIEKGKSLSPTWKKKHQQ